MYVNVFFFLKTSHYFICGADQKRAFSKNLHEGVSSYVSIMLVCPACDMRVLQQSSTFEPCSVQGNLLCISVYVTCFIKVCVARALERRFFANNSIETMSKTQFCVHIRLVRDKNPQAVPSQCIMNMKSVGCVLLLFYLVCVLLPAFILT